MGRKIILLCATLLILLFSTAVSARNALTPPGLLTNPNLFCLQGDDCELGTLSVGNLTVWDSYFNISVIDYNVTGDINLDGCISWNNDTEICYQATNQLSLKQSLNISDDLYVYDVAYIHDLQGLSPIRILDENGTPVGNFTNGQLNMEFFKGDGSQLFNLNVNESDGSFNIPGNLTVDGYTHLGDTSQLPLSASSLTNPGDLLVAGDTVFGKGAIILSEEYGQGLMVGPANESASIVRIIFNGAFDGTDNILCDPLSGFVEDDVDRYVIFTGTEPEITAPIDLIINSSCALLHIARYNVPDINPATVIITEAPFFTILDGSQSRFTLTDSDDTGLHVLAKNLTADDAFHVITDSGKDSTSSIHISGDANGYKSHTNILSEYRSDIEVNDTRSSNILLISNLINHDRGEFNMIEQSITDVGTNVTTNAFKLAPTTNIMLIDKDVPITASFYWNGTEYINTILNPGSEIWEYPGTFSCLGAEENYTKLTISFTEPASENLESVFLYPKNNVWTEFIPDEDQTEGYSRDGQVEVSVLPNRTSVNYGPNGVAFPSAENYTYLCSNRTNTNMLLQPPILNTFAISKEQFKMRIGNGGIAGEQDAVIFENTEQAILGGGLFQVDFINTEGVKESAFGLQTGAENYSAYIRNSACILSTRFLSDSQKSDKNYLYNCRQRASDLGLQDDLNFHSSVNGADLLVEHHMKAQGIATDDSLGNGIALLRGIYINLLRNNTYGTMFGGDGFNVYKQDTETVGLDIGDPENKAYEKWDSGNLGIFTSTTAVPYVWDFTTAGTCPDVTGSLGCVEAVTCYNGNDCEMDTGFSTSNFNNCNLSFHINAVDLSATRVFTIDFNNNTGSGDVNIYTLTTSLDGNATVALPSYMSNQTSVTSTVNFISAHPTRGSVWLDEFKVTCESMISTTTNRTKNNGEIVVGSTTENPCGIYLDDSFDNKNLDIQCANVTINGQDVTGGGGGGGVSGSGTTNAITKWVSSSAVGSSSMTDSGALVESSVPFKATIVNTSSRFYLPNGGSIGDNSTCSFIFYNSTDDIISTLGCT